MRNGLFVVIEGSGGSNEMAQLNLLKERLRAVGHEVEVFDFPRYDKESSYFVKKYLDGKYGSVKDVSPYTASLFYALDRYEAAAEITKAIDSGKIVLANNFAGSNMAHQGSKFDDEVQQRSFFVWADNLEFQLLNVPRPNVNFYLRVPADITDSRASKKPSGSNRKNSEQGPGRGNLRKLIATYDLLCQLFPKDFKAVECTEKGAVLGIARVNNLIWDQLKPMLPAKKSHASHSVVVTLGLDDGPEDYSSGANENTLNHDFKDASLLLRLHLQRLAPEAMPNTFDEWTDGKYRFFAPHQLSKNGRDKYKDSAERLSVLHQQLSQKMAKFMPSRDKALVSVSQLLQPTIPLGALSSFTFTIKKEEVNRVAGYLLAEEQDELQWAAKQLYLAARHKWPKEFEQPLESRTGPMALSNIIAKMADARLPQVFSTDESIKLLEARPRLEFDLLAESIYPYSSLSLDEISEEVTNWPYSQKHQSLKEAASQGETLRKVAYKLDILSDHLTLMKIISVTKPRSLQVQSFTPRYGYDMPQLIDEAGADDLYDAIFDESLALYSLLQSMDRDEAAPYATLMGHKLRWQMNANAAEMKLIIQDRSLAVSPVVKTIAEKLSEAHPLLWEVITSGQTAAVLPPAIQPKGKARVKPVNQRRTRKPKKS